MSSEKHNLPTVGTLRRKRHKAAEERGRKRHTDSKEGGKEGGRADCSEGSD